MADGPCPRHDHGRPGTPRGHRCAQGTVGSSDRPLAGRAAWCGDRRAGSLRPLCRGCEARGAGHAARGGPVPSDPEPPAGHPAAVQPRARRAIPVQSSRARAGAVRAARFGAGPAQPGRHRGLVRSGRAEARRIRFEQVKAVVADGQPFAVVARRTGLDCGTVAKWCRFDTAPQRRRKMPGAASPDAFRDRLARRWSEGCTLGRELLAEIRAHGYTGTITHLHRFFNPWGHAHIAAVTAAPAPMTPVLPPSIASPPVAAAPCVTPRGALPDGRSAPRNGPFSLTKEWEEPTRRHSNTRQHSAMRQHGDHFGISLDSRQ